MPSQRAVFNWLGKNEAFVQKYARAREVQADVYVQEVIDIADTPKLGVKRVDKPSGVEITEGDMVEHRRLQIDARKWAAARLSPKKYGDKVGLEHSGGQSLTVQVVKFSGQAGEDVSRNVDNSVKVQVKTQASLDA